jgi:hypothetical protein
MPLTNLTLTTLSEEEFMESEEEQPEEEEGKEGQEGGGDADGDGDGELSSPDSGKSNNRMAVFKRFLTYWKKIFVMLAPRLKVSNHSLKNYPDRPVPN